jgi:hypothetical protein
MTNKDKAILKAKWKLFYKPVDDLVEKYNFIIKLRNDFPDDSNCYKLITKTIEDFISDLKQLQQPTQTD